MQILYPDSANINPLIALRKAGYSHSVDPVTNEESFMIRIGQELYPRFHVYAEPHKGQLKISLHIDQKKAQYAGQKAHNGEYSGPMVERELARIAGWIRHEYGVLPSSSDAQEAQIIPPPSLQKESVFDSEVPTPPPTEKPQLFGGIF